MADFINIIPLIGLGLIAWYCYVQIENDKREYEVIVGSE